MQTRTERGMISVKEEFKTSEEAKKNGYTFAFYSTELKAECFSRIPGNNLNSREFCLVRKEG